MAIAALTLLAASADATPAGDQTVPAAGAAAGAASGVSGADQPATTVDRKQQQQLAKQLKKDQEQQRKEQAKRQKAEARQREKADRKRPGEARAGNAERAGEAPPADPVIQPVAGLAAAQRLARVVDLLNANDEKTARVELRALLAETPNGREALVLQQSIAGNPYDLVPRGSFSYIIAPGDSFITLARDYLGDSYKFYALARISGIAANMLKPGDTIQIPGRLRDPVRPGAAHPRPGYGRPRAWPRRVPNATPAAPATAGAAPAAAPADPATALRLRRQGLEQMTAGRIDAAVARLGRAQQLDPDNKAIAADLARARRIQGAVRTR